MGDKPSREQFSIGPYQVQHIPTGAKFGAYPGENDVCYINWGRIGDLVRFARLSRGLDEDRARVAEESAQNSRPQRAWQDATRGERS